MSDRESILHDTPYVDDAIAWMVEDGRWSTESAVRALLTRFSWMAVNTDRGEVCYLSPTKNEAQRVADKIQRDHGVHMELIRLP